MTCYKQSVLGLDDLEERRLNEQKNEGLMWRDAKFIDLLRYVLGRCKALYVRDVVRSAPCRRLAKVSQDRIPFRIVELEQPRISGRCLQASKRVI